MSILMSIILVMNCQASPMDARAESLLSVNSAAELKKKMQSFRESIKLESQCEFELSKRLVPKSCYQLKLTAEKLHVVDRACERASRIMETELSLKGLSKSCAEWVNKKNKDIRYSNEELVPSKLILENNKIFRN